MSKSHFVRALRSRGPATLIDLPKKIRTTHFLPPIENLALLEVVKDVNKQQFIRLSYQRFKLKPPDVMPPNMDFIFGEDQELKSFYSRAIDFVLKGTCDMASLAMIVEKYHDLLLSTCSVGQQHYELVSVVERMAIELFEKDRDFFLSDNKLNEALLLSCNLFQVSPPHCKYFRTKMIEEIVANCGTITRRQLALVVFSMILNREKLKKSTAKWLNHQCLKNFDGMSIEEVCLMCVAFHKTQTDTIDADLYDKITTQTIHNITKLQSHILLSSLVKGLNHGFHTPRFSLFIALLSFMESRPQTCFGFFHLQDFSVNKMCYLPSLLDRNLKNINENYGDFRNKDVERTFKAVAQYDHGAPNYELCREITKKIENDDQIISYERTFSRLIRSLCILDIHSEKLFNKYLSMVWWNFIDMRSSESAMDGGALNIMMARDYLMIDKYPLYQNRLKNLDSIFHAMQRHIRLRPRPVEFFRGQWAASAEEHRHVATIASISEAARECFKEYEIWFGHVVSFSQKIEVVLCKNSHHKNILNSDERKPGSLEGSIIVEVNALSQFSTRDCKMFSGSAKLRHRLLKKLGLKIISIPFWETNHSSHEEAVQYMQSKRDELFKQKNPSK
ncbi:uncharacterized protein LOC141850518 [Brevipalpus obovatus]|uniref:uncharacterized protein LOC141850518 n=1 Tax=Brevipalpus obovatus TaxID=246614 RepID=UPI003D9ED1F8